MSKRKIIIPTTEEITRIHDYLIENSGGYRGTINSPSYISDFCQSHLSDFGIIPVSAFLISRLAKGHYFIDGNKRTAYFAGRFGALRNGYDFDGNNPEEIVSEMEQIASMSEKESREYTEKLIKRDLIKNGIYLKDYSQFERLILKSIAVSIKLSKM